MKVKECRESICKDMNKLRRTGDVKLVRQVVDLIINLDKSKDKWDDGAAERWFLLRNIMNDDLTARGAHQLNSFYQGMKQAEEKREKGRLFKCVK